MTLCLRLRRKVRISLGRNNGLILIPNPAGKKTQTAPKATKKSQKDKDASTEDDVAQDVSALKVNETPPPKSKGLDVVKEFENSTNKRSISFVVVG